MPKKLSKQRSPIAATSSHLSPALLPSSHGFPSLPRLFLPLRFLAPHSRLLPRCTVLLLKSALRRRIHSPARVPSRLSAAAGPCRGLLRLRRRPAQAHRHTDHHHSRRRRIRGLPLPRPRTQGLHCWLSSYFLSAGLCYGFVMFFWCVRSFRATRCRATGALGMVFCSFSSTAFFFLCLGEWIWMISLEISLLICTCTAVWLFQSLKL